jgi:hypothetical protein
MSDSMIVFIRSEDIPTIQDLRNALKIEGVELEPWDGKSLQDVEGFWPGKYKGQDAGFEFMLGEIDNDDLEDWGIGKEQLKGRDYMLELAFYTEEDIAASAICAAFFCKTCDGITFDDDGDLSVGSSNYKEWIKNYI